MTVLDFFIYPFIAIIGGGFLYALIQLVIIIYKTFTEELPDRKDMSHNLHHK